MKAFKNLLALVVLVLALITGYQKAYAQQSNELNDDYILIQMIQPFLKQLDEDTLKELFEFIVVSDLSLERRVDNVVNTITDDISKEEFLVTKEINGTNYAIFRHVPGAMTLDQEDLREQINEREISDYRAALAILHELVTRKTKKSIKILTKFELMEGQFRQPSDSREARALYGRLRAYVTVEAIKAEVTKATDNELDANKLWEAHLEDVHEEFEAQKRLKDAEQEKFDAIWNKVNRAELSFRALKTQFQSSMKAILELKRPGLFGFKRVFDSVERQEGLLMAIMSGQGDFPQGLSAAEKTLITPLLLDLQQTFSLAHQTILSVAVPGQEITKRSVLWALQELLEAGVSSVELKTYFDLSPQAILLRANGQINEALLYSNPSSSRCARVIKAQKLLGQ